MGPILNVYDIKSALNLEWRVRITEMITIIIINTLPGKSHVYIFKLHAKKPPSIYTDMCLRKVLKNSTLSVLTLPTGCEQYACKATDKNEMCLHHLPFNGRIKGFQRLCSM